MALAGVAIDSDLFLLPALVDSDLYVIKRAVRYLDEPSSQVGLFSYLRLLLYIGLFALAKCLERGTNVKELALDRFLRRVSHGSLALTLLVSFVPLMHFRAVVLADFFSILFVLNVLDRNLRFSFDRVAVATLCGLFSLWYYFDLANYVSADRIYTYQTWFGQLK